MVRVPRRQSLGAAGGLLVLLAAVGVPFAGCSGGHGPSTDFALRLRPDSSCSSAPVECVDTLKVDLADPAGAPLGTWTLPFSITGAPASLGSLPTRGQGAFRVVGSAAVTPPVAVFSGTSGLVTFQPKNDQIVDVPVSCPSIPNPCATATPSPTPPLFVTGTNANLVLGQADFTSCANNVTVNSQLTQPDGLLTDDGTRLYIADKRNGRVAVWTDKTTLTNGQRIDLNGDEANGFVIGHSDSGVNGTNGASANRFGATTGVAWIPGVAILAVDQGNNRLPVMTPTPSASNASAVVAIGQGGTGTANSGTSATRIDTPYGVAWNSTAGLWVSDTNNNRILSYGTNPASFIVDDAPALHVLGQSLITAGNPNHGATTDAIGLNKPAHIALVGRKLYVVDTFNNRVLVWNDVTTVTDGQAADLVIGQPNFTSNSANAGQAMPNAYGLAAPLGITATKDRLVIADSGNNRLLVWEPPPTAPMTAATEVLGQPDFTTVTPNTGGTATSSCNDGAGCPNVPNAPTAASMYRPGAVWLDGNDLWVSDTCNHRATRFTAHAP